MRDLAEIHGAVMPISRPAGESQPDPHSSTLAERAPQRLALAWQISPRREPEPDPDRASTLGVRFDEQEPGRTVIRLTHRDFERHGSGAEEYRAALAAPAGWPYILQRFREAAT